MFYLLGLGFDLLFRITMRLPPNKMPLSASHARSLRSIHMAVLSSFAFAPCPLFLFAVEVMTDYLALDLGFGS